MKIKSILNDFALVCVLLMSTPTLAQLAIEQVSMSEAFWEGSMNGELKVVFIHATDSVDYESVENTDPKFEKLERAVLDQISKDSKVPTLFIVQSDNDKFESGLLTKQVEHIKGVIGRELPGKEPSVITYLEPITEIHESPTVARILEYCSRSIENTKFVATHLGQSGKTFDRTVQIVGASQALGIAGNVTVRFHQPAEQQGKFSIAQRIAVASVVEISGNTEAEGKENKVQGEVVLESKSGSRVLSVAEFLDTPVQVTALEKSYFSVTGKVDGMGPYRMSDIGKAMLLGTYRGITFDNDTYTNHAMGESITEEYKVPEGARLPPKARALEIESQIVYRLNERSIQAEMAAAHVHAGQSQYLGLKDQVEGSNSKAWIAEWHAAAVAAALQQQKHFGLNAQGELTVDSAALQRTIFEVKEFTRAQRAGKIRAKK